MNREVGTCGPGEGKAWAGIHDGAQLKLVTVFGRDAMARRHLEAAVFAKPQIAEFSAADAQGILKNCLEDRLKLAGRARDDA